MRFVIAGGKGALGSRLTTRLSNSGHEVVVLTRNPSPNAQFKEAKWDAKTVGEWSDCLEGAAIINLAGELVDRRPTPSNIELLRSSRVNATLALKRALETRKLTAPLWLQMSSLAIYGNCSDTILDENAKPIEPLPQMTGVAQPWEEAFAGAPAKRSMILRTGIVLDNNVPAMNRLTGIVKFGLGGRIGNGKQWISWIHVDDFLLAIEFLINTTAIDGVVHVTSPEPVTNAHLMAALRRELHRPPAIPTPALAVKLGAVVLNSDAALALTGRRCVPAKLIDAGFDFKFPTIDDALADLL